MLYWLQQAAESDSESVSKFLKRWSAVAAAYVSFDFSDQVSELMLQLDQNAAVSTEAQNVLVWAILTNSSRKNAAWSLLQRTQATPHARHRLSTVLPWMTPRPGKPPCGCSGRRASICSSCEAGASLQPVFGTGRADAVQ